MTYPNVAPQVDPSGNVFSNKVHAFHERIKAKLHCLNPATLEKIIPPPMFALFDKLVDSLEVPGLKEVIALGACIYELVKLVPAQRHEGQEFLDFVTNLLSCCVGGEIDEPGCKELQTQLQFITEGLIKWQMQTSRWMTAFVRSGEFVQLLSGFRQRLDKSVEKFKIVSLLSLNKRHARLEELLQGNCDKLDKIHDWTSSADVNLKEMKSSIDEKNEQFSTFKKKVFRAEQKRTGSRIYAGGVDALSHQVETPHTCDQLEGWIYFKAYQRTPCFTTISGVDVIQQHMKPVLVYALEGEKNAPKLDVTKQFQDFLELYSKVPPHPYIVAPIALSGADAIVPFPHLCHDFYDYTVPEYLSSFPCSYVDRLKLVYQLALAVDHLHAHNIVHAHLCSKNVHYYDGNLLLKDLCFAKEITSGNSTVDSEHSVEPQWKKFFDPEVLRTGKADRQISRESDVYSFAMTALHILSNKRPFDEMDMSTFKINIVRNTNRKMPTSEKYPLVIPLALEEQDCESLCVISEVWNECRKSSPSKCVPEGVKRDLIPQFSNALRLEAGQKVEEVWTILESCWTPKASARPQMRDIVAKLEQLRPDLKDCKPTPDFPIDSPISLQHDRCFLP